MHRSDVLWLTWAGFCLATFLVPELYAVFSGHPSWKLSASVWRLEDAVGHPLVWRVVALVLLAWLAYHLFYGSRH